MEEELGKKAAHIKGHIVLMEKNNNVSEPAWAENLKNREPI